MMEVNEMDDSLIALCKEGILPKLPFRLEDYDGEKPFEKHFNDSSEVKVTLMPISEKEQVLSKLVQKIELEWWSKLSSKSRAVIITFLSEHFEGSKPWSSKKCANLVRKFCSELCSKIQEDSQKNDSYLGPWFVKNFEECLTHQESDFYNILKLVKVKFTKSEWKYYPACVYGFGWIVKQLKYPFLGNAVDLVIPPALLFTDDYYEDYRKLGVECLSHIILNVDKNDLTQSNWALVIYDAVNRVCDDKDPAIIEMAMQIIMMILSITEKDPAENSSEFTKYDNVLKTVIYNLELSSEIEVKRAWLLQLDKVLSVIGTATLHWSDRICSMLKDSTSCNDATIWNIILQVTSTLIRNTWLKADCQNIGEIILRVLFNCSCFHTSRGVGTRDMKIKIIDNVKQCLELLSKCNGYEIVSEQIKEIIEKGESESLHPDFIQTLKEVMT